jgi:UDP-N-acetylmuramate: L-alanyl-gamma-D-glutamyl-meso-diaminopimelate ligase
MGVNEIYMIGMCGIAMGTLASMLREKGFAVSGSDRNIYPPMSDMLRRQGILLHEGFMSEHIKNPDLVVIGNAVARGNPEAEYVLDRGIPYCSMAQALQAYFLRGMEVVAVCGTHGKTTTAALLSHILVAAGLSPSFFVGGAVRNYDSSHRLGSGGLFIIEGDEYDSAFFEKIPKFMVYRPRHLVLTSLEFDHADIYRDLCEIELWFKRLVNIIPSKGNIVYSSDYANLGSIVSTSLSQCYSFGAGHSDFRCVPRGNGGEFAELDIERPGGGFRVRTRLLGGFNYANLLAAAAMAKLLGADESGIRQGIESFEGVRRRQELIYRRGNVSIYEDFAHHPTAVKNTLEAIKMRHSDARVWAVFEPRSATSRRSVFQHVLPASFAAADVIIIKEPYRGSFIKNEERLDIDFLLNDIRSFNQNAHVFREVNDIIARITGSIDLEEKNVIVLMSNGGFDGIYARIVEAMDGLMAAGVPH